MDPFEQVDENLRRREQTIEARELKARLKEIEKELAEMPVTPTQKHDESVAAPIIPSAPQKSRQLSQQATDVGKFVLIVFSVIVAIRVAAWVGMALMVSGVVWVAYKLLIENKKERT